MLCLYWVNLSSHLAWCVCLPIAKSTESIWVNYRIIYACHIAPCFSSSLGPYRSERAAKKRTIRFRRGAHVSDVTSVFFCAGFSQLLIISYRIVSSGIVSFHGNCSGGSDPLLGEGDNGGGSHNLTRYFIGKTKYSLARRHVPNGHLYLPRGPPPTGVVLVGPLTPIPRLLPLPPHDFEREKTLGEFYTVWEGEFYTVWEGEGEGKGRKSSWGKKMEERRWKINFIFSCFER